MLVNLSTLTPTMQDALRRLVAAIRDHDGIPPINESGSLGIDGVREADFFFMGRRCDPFGFVLCDERDGTLQVGVHPDHRREGVGTELLTEALSSYPDFTAWAFGTLPGADELAARVRMEPVRQLLRMERPLAPAGQAPAEAEGYEIVTYDPADREAIVAINAAAFSHHPEQGRLTVAEFEPDRPARRTSESASAPAQKSVLGLVVADLSEAQQLRLDGLLLPAINADLGMVLSP